MNTKNKHARRAPGWADRSRSVNWWSRERRSTSRQASCSARAGTGRRFPVLQSPAEVSSPNAHEFMSWKYILKLSRIHFGKKVNSLYNTKQRCGLFTRILKTYSEPTSSCQIKYAPNCSISEIVLCYNETHTPCHPVRARLFSIKLMQQSRTYERISANRKIFIAYWPARVGVAPVGQAVFASCSRPRAVRLNVSKTPSHGY